MLFLKFFNPSSGALFLGVLWLTSGLLAHAESTGGKGGPTLQVHMSNLSRFDSEISGLPILIGGYGFGNGTKKLRFGGGGGGGFVLNGSENLQFGLGYGGVVGEYELNKWLLARLLVGGGGYGVVKVVSETNTEITVNKISTGGFFLFYPQINADIKVGNTMKFGIGLGYFLPTVSRLDSFTLHLSLMLGRG